MPIDVEFRFSFGKPIWDVADLPDGWAVTLAACGEPAVQHFPTARGQRWMSDHEGYEVPVRLAFLVNPDGMYVATWDEGRWWTPDESNAWLTMLTVPATYVMAEGMRQQQMPRWWRRARKRRPG